MVSWRRCPRRFTGEWPCVRECNGAGRLHSAISKFRWTIVQLDLLGPFCFFSLPSVRPEDEEDGGAGEQGYFCEGVAVAGVERFF